MNVIFTCGGTGGHINPAIAVANTLRERYPDCKILFIGAKDNMEEKLVPRAGYALKCINCAAMCRQLNLQGIRWNIKAVGVVRNAVKECRKIIREFCPDVIVGTGGFASFPALYAGSTMGIPTCVHESNAVPGLTTKMVAKRADKVLVAFDESAKYYHRPERVEVVGMPVRREFMSIGKAQARAALGLDERPLVVSAFGSLGAKAMNCAVAELLRLEQEAGFPFQHIHATGSYGWAWMPEYLKKLGVDPPEGSGLDVREYIYDMPTVMAAADVIISRAGASSCNEIGASGTPCVLIPSPNVTNNHQEKNARILEQRGAAIVIPESECTPQKLYDTIVSLMGDNALRGRMSASLRNMVVLDSAERICDRIVALAQSGSR